MFQTYLSILSIIPCVLNIYICWSFVCLFFKNLVQKRKHQKAKRAWVFSDFQTLLQKLRKLLFQNEKQVRNGK